MTIQCNSVRLAFLCGLLAATAASAQLKAPRSGGPSLAAPPAASSTTAPTPSAPAASSAESTTGDTAQMEKAGELTALGWLMLLDRKDWGSAWESSSQVFRTQVPIGTWMDAIPKVREPLGTLTERERLEIAYKSALPGRPAGDYVTVIFASRFTNRPDTQEVVTTARDADGKWRVLGYSTR